MMFSWMSGCSGGSVGRRRNLAALPVELDAERSTGRGPVVLIGGRRRAGQSWLVEEFLARHGLPNVFFTATRDAADEHLPRFADALAQSPLPDDARAQNVRFSHSTTSVGRS